MRRLESLITASFLFGLAFISCTKGDPDVAEHKRLLEENPRNCFAAKQFAYEYQQGRQYEAAIQYFEKAIQNCAKEPMLKFQLGVTHILSGDRSLGFQLLDDTISDARSQGDEELLNVLLTERKFWDDKSRE